MPSKDEQVSREFITAQEIAEIEKIVAQYLSENKERIKQEMDMGNTALEVETLKNPQAEHLQKIKAIIQKHVDQDKEALDWLENPEHSNNKSLVSDLLERDANNLLRFTKAGEETVPATIELAGELIYYATNLRKM